MLAAGRLAHARLAVNAEGNATVALGGSVPELVQPLAQAWTFKAARKQPIFYGAAATGALVAVHCRVLSNRIVTFAHAIDGVRVKQVNAAAGLCVIFTCNLNHVWLINLAEPAALVQIGCVTPGETVVAAFASATVAFVAARSPGKTVSLVPVCTTEYSRSTWGALPSSIRILDPPLWAACCTCHLHTGLVTAFVAGTKIVAAQLKAHALLVRSKLVKTSRSSAVSSVAVAQGSLLCLLENGTLIRITDNSKCKSMGIKTALSDTGHTF